MKRTTEFGTAKAAAKDAKPDTKPADAPPKTRSRGTNGTNGSAAGASRTRRATNPGSAPLGESDSASASKPRTRKANTDTDPGSAPKPRARTSAPRTPRTSSTATAKSAQLEEPAKPTRVRARRPVGNTKGAGESVDLVPPRTKSGKGGVSFGRLFGILLGAMAVVAIVLVAAQNAPTWLSGASADAPGAAATSGAAGLAMPTDIANGRIGIVSGHRGNDSGTVCQDGLTEAEVNFNHATRVASFLRAEGYTVDILDEFDERLKGYRAEVLLSIHADSCTFINDQATGYKVARALESSIPATEDELVACLRSRYQAATGLQFHANTVTYDMTQYHAFREIDSDTPAAIIETGFLYLDRPMLERKPEVVAKGITDGLLCYLRHQQP